jgi:Fur family transcriptional regulator, peroxide stress response regulator
MHSIEMLAQRVREHGGKVTSQRLLIWRALSGNRDHPTADELYGQLVPALPGLSLATLYKALNELVEWGEVRRFDTGDGRTHFDPNTTTHAEVVCLRCHTVIDAPEIAVPPDIPTQIAGYHIVGCAEQYYGYCPNCRAAKERQSKFDA